MMLYKSRGLVQPFLADFLCSLRALNRRCELQRLVAWAEGKRLERPLRLYRDRLREEDARLLKYRIRAPRAMRLASWTHTIVDALFPPPHVYRSGAASGYRRKFDRKPKFAYSMKV